MKKLTSIRVRIAPSPTGMLHIGTARTALFNYLFAKKHNEKFILRIEDTDLERSDKKYEKNIFEGFEWLGIEADESPIVGGPHKHYRQSERIHTYTPYLEKLLKEEKAFYCFHSEEELEKEKEELMVANRPPLHICEYRNMRISEARTLTETKPNYIIRFKTPLERTITFNDLIRGEVSFASDLIGDFSIAKRIDIPLYNFAVVIDDHEMKISHVIRGEDHIANTPKQILLFKALGLTVPLFAHLPLILGTDRSKLSKRHGATSVTEYREAGYLPEALFNFMALLGWNPGGDQELFSKEELIDRFSLEHIQKAGAIFDIAKLDWMNGEYIRKKSVAELTQLCLPYLNGFPLDKFIKEYLEKVIALEQPRLKKLSEIGERVEYFFREPLYDKELLRWKKISDQEISTSLEYSEKIISDFESPIAKHDIEQTFLKEIGGGDKGSILWPLRVALTGKKASPGPFEIIEILGKEKTLERIFGAKKLLITQ